MKVLIAPNAFKGNLNSFEVAEIIASGFSSRKLKISVFPIADRKVDFRISSGFGKRMDPFDHTEKHHFGIDIIAPLGTPIIATASGQVREAKFQKNGYGNYVWIDHAEGISTRYAQLERYIVKEDDMVKQGQVIGYLGSSGRSTAPHLHYAVMRNSRHVDPSKYIQDYDIKVKSKE